MNLWLALLLIAYCSVGSLIYGATFKAAGDGESWGRFLFAWAHTLALWWLAVLVVGIAAVGVRFAARLSAWEARRQRMDGHE
jgi:hypothetical protein